jgi:hypothetical protein
MLKALFNGFKEDWVLFLARLAAVSTPQLGIIYGLANRQDARDLVTQVPAVGVARPPRLIA